MKRNMVSILKYLIIAALILTLGPLLMKMFIGDGPLIRAKGRNSNYRMLAKGAGPVDPDEVNRIFQPREWDFQAVTTPRAEFMPRETPKPAKVSETLGKIDWHNYEQIEEELKRTGPGEQGESFTVEGEEEEKERLYSVNGFNALASDKISLDRAINDIRHPDCKLKTYLPRMLNASVVVPFHNEHWTTLLRTVKSVLNRSPKHLLHEIILVDDYSTKEHCKQPLDDYLSSHFSNVKVVRQKKREGLIRTRIAGAKAATGQVLIFLDSHIEANTNWLPPLLEPITENYKTVVCPFIDVIDFDTFAYRAQDEGARGAFDWQFFYKRLPLLKRDIENPSKPFKSPVMAGGLFAISTKWFWELGGYDPGLDIWGGEQYELSFKIWQCGGRMLDAPCSRVGHIYRKFAPFPNPGVGDFIARNYKRVAEVWMDEYKEYIYMRKPHYRKVDAGDMTDQLAIRDKLQCKPFKWFMTKVAFDLPKKYPMVNPPDVAEGEVRNRASKKCLDTKFGGDQQRVSSQECKSDNKNENTEQDLKLTWHNDIRPKQRLLCFDVSRSDYKSPIILYTCHGLKGNQWFKYDLSTQQIFHPITNMCVDTDSESGEVFMTQCENRLTQKWDWTSLNETLVKQAWLAKRDEEEYDGEPPDSDL